MGLFAFAAMHRKAAEEEKLKKDAAPTKSETEADETPAKKKRKRSG